MIEFALHVALIATVLGAACLVGAHALCAALRFFGFIHPVPRSLPIAGVVSMARVARFVKKSVRGLEPVFAWGGILLPESHFASHGSVLSGAPGSGKSLCMQMLEKSVLAPEGELCAHAIVFDPKATSMPELVGMGISLEQLRVLNPFDARSRPVHFAVDFTTEAQARQLATILVPDGARGAHPFFDAAVRDLFSLVVIAFQRQHPNSWTFAQVLRVLRSADSIRSLVGKSLEGKAAVTSYFRDPKLESHVMATMRSRMQVFETAAALWENSSNDAVSLSAWVKEDEPSVLVFGHDAVHDAVVGPINRALFLRLSQLLLGRPEASVTRPTWVFLDEARLFGRLEGLQSLLFAGRSYQVRTTLAFQDFDGLASVWGDKEAGELIGQCGNVATFRLWNPSTMDLASRFYGERIEWVRGSGSSVNHRGEETSSENWSQQIRRLFLPADFRNLPGPTPQTGIDGVFTTPSLPIWRGPIPPRVVSALLPKPAVDVPGFVPRPPSDQSFGDACDLSPSPSEPPSGGLRTMSGDNSL